MYVVIFAHSEVQLSVQLISCSVALLSSLRQFLSNVLNTVFNERLTDVDTGLSD